MRLLNTQTLQLTLFDGEPLPEYAILSHRWENEEISLPEFLDGLGTEKRGYKKIAAFCNEAKRRGFEWCWVDTCGIDKKSSAELSEAINSMYKWYEKSAVCFVYLPDVKAKIQPDSVYSFADFNSSCWFTRGWTLQELIAPRSVEFYTSDWVYVCDKRSKVDELSHITGVDRGILLGTSPVRSASVARIMSWASKRVTARKEDIAYCLLGLFGISMPLLYGEGDRAFIRLQEEILKQSSDQSLFAWNPPQGVASQASAIEKDAICGIFSPSPACFAESRDIMPVPEYWDTESTLTNRGVRLKMPFKYDALNKTFLGILCCASSSSIKDVAIEFQSASNSLEDLDHLIRRSTGIRYGNWSHDSEVRFNVVYLATDTSLWHAQYYGLQFLKPQFEFHVLVRDMENFLEPKATSELYPPAALVGKPSVTFEDTTEARRITVLDPLKGPHNRVAVLLPTKLSQNIALIVGFRTLEGGLPDVRQPWKIAVPIPKDHLLKDIWSDVKEPLPSTTSNISKITIDGVSVSVEITQQSWWAKSSRNILIKFSPIGDKQPDETSFEGVRYFKISDDSQNLQSHSLISAVNDTGISYNSTEKTSWGYLAEIESPMLFTKLLLDPTEDVVDFDRGISIFKKLLRPDETSISSKPSIKSAEMEDVD